MIALKKSALVAATPPLGLLLAAQAQASKPPRLAMDTVRKALLTGVLLTGALTANIAHAAPAQAANPVNIEARIDEGLRYFNEVALPNWVAAHEVPLPLPVADTQELPQQPQPQPAPKSDDGNSSPSMGVVGVTLLTLFVQAVVCATTGICALTLP